MIEKQPLVSIGIPTYNRPRALRSALDSLLSQTYQNVEIIVSDNCSTNIDVADVVEEYKHRYPDIKFFDQDRNIGGIANFEFVLSEAAGKYFMWAADDDLCKPEMISLMVAKMEENHNAVLCGCDISVIDGDGYQIRNELLEGIHKAIKWTQARHLFFTYPISNVFFVVFGLHVTESVRISAPCLRPGWRRYLTNCEVPFLAKVATLGEIIAVPEILKIYRSHSDSVYQKELKSISKASTFILRLMIRLKLISIALKANIPVWDRLVLLKTIVVPWITSLINFVMNAIIPKRIKKFLKGGL